VDPQRIPALVGAGSRELADGDWGGGVVRRSGC